MQLVTPSTRPLFVSKEELRAQTGLTRSAIKRLRDGKTFKEGLHYVKPSPHIIIYNLPLILDQLANSGDPMAHQRAINAYLASLLSNQKAAKAFATAA